MILRLSKATDKEWQKGQQTTCLMKGYQRSQDCIILILPFQSNEKDLKRSAFLFHIDSIHQASPLQSVRAQTTTRAPRGNRLHPRQTIYVAGAIRFNHYNCNEESRLCFSHTNFHLAIDHHQFPDFLCTSRRKKTRIPTRHLDEATPGDRRRAH